MDSRKKTSTIKNKHYRQFLDNGVINLLTVEQINQALDNVKGKHRTEGRALLIALYYTGGRPNEVLRLQAKNITNQKSYIIIQIKGSKRGLPRPIYLQNKRKLVKELYKYACSLFPEQLLFFNYKSKYIRKCKNGDRLEFTDSLRYYFKIWFKGVVEDPIPPYFLRHNRFSKLSEAGVDDNSLMQLKGSRTFQSIQAYKHLSVKSAKLLAKKID